MEQRKYDRATAKAIFEMICWPECWVIRDKGVFVEDGFRLHSPRDKVFDWTPAYEMDWPGAPNPMTAPTLPIDFTARELAASMIDGVGRQIQEALNRRIGYALDDDALQGFGSYQSWVREALTEAYDVARQAQDVVGELDRNQQQRADDLWAKYRDAYSQALEREKVMEYVIIGYGKDEKPEYGLIPRDEHLPRLARAKESVAVQKAQAEQAEEQADAAFKAWRKAMVRQLLQPQATTPSPAPVPQVAPPVAVIDFDKDGFSKILAMAGMAVLNIKVAQAEATNHLENSPAAMKMLNRLMELQEKRELKNQAPEPQATTNPAPEPPAAPVVADSAHGGVEADKAGPVNKKWVMKKAALINKHTCQWATIKGDFHSASENGLSQAAKAPGHGEWFEADALKWAEQRGKLKKEEEQGPATLATVWTGKKHTLRD